MSKNSISGFVSRPKFFNERKWPTLKSKKFNFFLETMSQIRTSECLLFPFYWRGGGFIGLPWTMIFTRISSLSLCNYLAVVNPSEIAKVQSFLTRGEVEQRRYQHVGSFEVIFHSNEFVLKFSKVPFSCSIRISSCFSEWASGNLKHVLFYACTTWWFPHLFLSWVPFRRVSKEIVPPQSPC